MQILFVHQNFPGQFRHLWQALLHTPGVEIRAITDYRNPNSSYSPMLRYVVGDETTKSVDILGDHFAVRARRGDAAARVMLHLRQSGYMPDIVVGHVGWGETLFVKDVWPKCCLIVHAEFYYSAEGADVGFDPEFSRDLDVAEIFRVRAKNASILSTLIDADFGIAPTRWQAGRFPPELRHKMRVLHEGIDTQLLRPDPAARFTLNGASFGAEDEVITFVSRNLEPYRGYHAFMRALPEVLAARPRAHAIIVGGDETSYGRPPTAAEGSSWKDVFLSEVQDRLPMNRVHFPGRIS
ncbi:MAG: glycosyl transferase family 1, partial [Methylobacteriaceae bacterium]|nr:glycosyl transferase family 1 [Methylobacteriaceae bacterium]